MKVDTKRIGLVRGYVIYSQWRAGCIGMEQAMNKDIPEVDIAYTHWHRHDVDPYIVESELEKLRKCYESFEEYEGCMIGYEYRDYKK